MIIKRVTVKRLRAIEDKTIDFSPGLNIIKGSDNEAGKSSLRIAITKALFQDATTTQKDVEALTRWGAGEPWEVSLEFQDDADSCRIIKSFKDKVSELTCTGPHAFVARNKNAIAEKIAELTGCPSEVFFESTACVKQDELIRIIPRDATTAEKRDAVGTITKRLQAKLSGWVEVDIPALLTRLYDKTHHKGAGGPHLHLATVIERIANLRSLRVEQEQKVGNILEARRKFAQAREELRKIDQELPAKRELLEKNRKMQELERDIDRDQAQYDSFQRARDLKSRIDNLESELGRFSHFVDSEAKVKLTNATRDRLAELSRQRSDLQDDLKALRGQRPALWLLISGLALGAGGLAGLITSYLTFIAAPGLILLAYWWVGTMVWQKQVKLAMLKAGNLDRELGENTEKGQILLSEFACKSYDEYEASLAEYRTKAEAKRDAFSRLDVLLADRDWQSFVQENTNTEIQMSARLKELQQIEPFRLEPLPLQKLEQEVNNLLRRKVELEQEKGALDKFLSYTDADKDELTDIQEELEKLEAEKEFWERKRKIYDTTREIIEQAHKQTLSKAADLLEAEISRYVAVITKGRYAQVKIDESDLAIRTFSPEKNDWVDVSVLSRATQDQFYICARLALVRLITEGKKPPILLDDPFVNFHAKRLRQTISLLQEMAAEYQILLFTCSDSYDYLGTVVSIDDGASQTQLFRQSPA